MICGTNKFTDIYARKRTSERNRNADVFRNLFGINMLSENMKRKNKLKSKESKKSIKRKNAKQ